MRLWWTLWILVLFIELTSSSCNSHCQFCSKNLCVECSKGYHKNPKRTEYCIKNSSLCQEYDKDSGNCLSCDSSVAEKVERRGAIFCQQLEGSHWATLVIVYLVTFVTFCIFLLSALRYKFYAVFNFLTCGLLSFKKKQVENSKRALNIKDIEEQNIKKVKSIQDMSSLVISRRQPGKPISISKRMRKASLGFPFEGQGGQPGNNFSIISPIKFGRRNSQDIKGGDRDPNQSGSDIDDDEEEKIDNLNDDLIDTQRKTGQKSKGEFDLGDHLAPMSSSRNTLLGGGQKYRDDFN